MDLKEYFSDFNKLLENTIGDEKVKKDLLAVYDLIVKTKDKKTKIIIIGNGGSAAIAEHMAIDLSKNAKLRAIAISGTPQITTYANDYGYENVYSKAIEIQADEGDVLVAISSGGESVNILNAVDTAKKIGCEVVTFSAFEKNNSLRAKGDINLYVESSAYGYAELIHHIMLHFISDKIIGSAVYKIQ